MVRSGARPGSKLAGACELLSDTSFLLAEGTNLDTVYEAELTASFAAVRSDVLLFAASCVVCELARKVGFRDLENPFLYALTRAALACCANFAGHAGAACAAGHAGAVGDVRSVHAAGHVGAAGAQDPADPADLTSYAMALVAAFAIKLCAHEGFLLEMGECVLCREALMQDVHQTAQLTSHPCAYSQNLYISLEQGGVLCASCAYGQEGLECIDEATRVLMQSLLMLRFQDIKNKDFNYAALRSALRLSHIWAAHVFDARLYAFDFFESSL